MRSNRRPKLRQVLALASPLLFATLVEGAEAEASMVSSPLSSITSVTLELSGMHCAGCSFKIRKALKSVDGVLSLHEGATKKLLIVKFDPARTNTKTLIKTVRDTGYDAAIER